MYLSGTLYPLTIEGQTLGAPIRFRLPRREKKLTLSYSCGSLRGVIARQTLEEEICWTPPETLAAQYPTGTGIPVTLVLEDGKAQRQERMELLLPGDAAPRVQVTLENAQGTDTYVQQVSQLHIAVRAEGAYGAKIRKTAVSCGSLTGEGTDLVFDLPRAGAIPVTVRVEDSRGCAADWQGEIPVLPYTPPAGGFRKAGDGGEGCIIEYWGRVLGLGGKNTGTCAWISVRKGVESRKELSSGLAMAGTITLEKPVEEEAWFLEVKDGFTAVRIPYIRQPLLDIDRENRALGIGCRGDRTGTVSLGLGVNFGGRPLENVGAAQRDTDALPLGQGDGRYLMPRLLWENPNPKSAFPPGAVAAEGTVFLIAAAPKAEAEEVFWELGCPGGLLRGEAARSFSYETGELHFGTTEKGDDWTVPRKIYRLL